MRSVIKIKESAYERMVCTCGKCLGGYLSPRNARALSETASASAEMLRESLPDFPGAFICWNIVSVGCIVLI